MTLIFACPSGAKRMQIMRAKISLLGTTSMPGRVTKNRRKIRDTVLKETGKRGTEERGVAQLVGDTCHAVHRGE